MHRHTAQEPHTKPRIYIAGPLSREYDRHFNILLKETLDERFHVYLPQEDGGLMVDMITNGVRREVAARSVFREDILALRKCDLLLLVMNGQYIDEGAAFELGYVYSRGKLCYGIHTEYLADHYCYNPMLSCSLLQIFHTLGELEDWAKNYQYDSESKYAIKR